MFNINSCTKNFTLSALSVVTNDATLNWKCTFIEKIFNLSSTFLISPLKSVFTSFNSKTLNEDKNTKINDIKSDLSGEIKKVDDKLNNLSIKVPFHFKVATIVATDKADKVEIFATTLKVYPNDGLLRRNFSPGPIKDVSYDILSRASQWF